MRIIYIHQYFKHPKNARGSRGYEMARRLAARGHDVQVIASTSKMDTETQEQVENLTIHWLPVPYSQLMSYKQRIRSFFQFAVRASRTARKLKGDIIFATSTPLTVAIPGIIATLFRKQPLIFEVRDLWPDAPIAMGALTNKFAQKLALALERITYLHSSHIVALSPDMRDGIISKGIEPDKITVIPNAADLDLFDVDTNAAERFRKKHTWLGDRKLVLYCGTLGLVNDVSYTARLAAATLKRDPSIRFLVVGNGNDKKRVKETAQKLGVYHRNFFMMDSIPKTEVPILFAAADISISTVAPKPLLAANSANKVFDTFASGTPLGINHEGWLAELLRETKAGIVLSSTNLELASQTLLDFLYSHDKMQQAAQRSKNLAITKFDREKLAHRLIQVLENEMTDASSKRITASRHSEIS